MSVSRGRSKKGLQILTVLLFQYPYETLFRSLQYALLDNSCREYLFLSDFFMVSGSGAQDLYNAIMGKTLSMIMVSWFSLVFN